MARGILGYITDQMMTPEGGVACAEDADSQPSPGAKAAEGAFYVWTWNEVMQVLGERNGPIFAAVYGMKQNGNVPPGADPHSELKGKNVLMRSALDDRAIQSQFKLSAEELNALLTESLAKLRAVRAKRPRPPCDDSTSICAAPHVLQSEECDLCCLVPQKSWRLGTEWP